mmetsp:Transcript_6241/g.13738  ORF Transcript_6241/g.13738 Transcript_6241/m.13738 type:complete len:194 (+) Transcript_6241:155-736(+)|eukprot:CAMPEP_0178415534 /NCGR_PEP_ID=MMETSP0689_2-20121128/23599_1 /TAXON_ID=160604 /ORGANISM="Amphidinium massartii, Strain CS-259" /LENGTH=193 /DNA_ID=CAMNT_0020036853 /DNA_START=71 /DNA_END=652 /DNA_ORIENTATION=-
MAAMGMRIGTAAVRASAASSSPRMLHVCGPELSPRGRQAISSFGSRLGCDVSPGRAFNTAMNPMRGSFSPGENHRTGGRLSFAGVGTRPSSGLLAAAAAFGEREIQEPRQVPTVNGGIAMGASAAPANANNHHSKPAMKKPAFPRLLGRAGREAPSRNRKREEHSPPETPSNAEDLAAAARNAFLARQRCRGC